MTAEKIAGALGMTLADLSGELERDRLDSPLRRVTASLAAMKP